MRLGSHVPDVFWRWALRELRCEPRWRSVLLFLYWGALESIAVQKRGWSPDEDELWSDVVWCFLRSIDLYDVERRETSIAKRIYGDTVHRLFRVYQSRWKVAERQICPDGNEEKGPDGYPDPSWRDSEADVEWRCDRESRRRWYMSLLRRRLIDATDYELLCGTRLSGWTIAVCAGRLGLNLDAAKKRLQRAEARIRAGDPLAAKFLSPSRLAEGHYNGEAHIHGGTHAAKREFA